MGFAWGYRALAVVTAATITAATITAASTGCSLVGCVYVSNCYFFSKCLWGYFPLVLLCVVVEEISRR